MEDLAPVASMVPPYLRPWLSRRRVEEGLAEFLLDKGRNTSALLSVWLLAGMLDRPGALPTNWVDYARMVAQDRNEPGYHRAIAASVVARGGHTADLAWLRRQISTEYDPDLLRAYLVALARVGALDGGTAARATGRRPELTKTVVYLKGRRALPSLIYADEVVRVENGG